MSENKKIVILHNEVGEFSSPDEKDVIDQVNSVSKALERLGHEFVSLPVSLDLNKTLEELKKINPDGVFNLVESIESSGKLIHLAPSLLDLLRIPYSGSDTTSIFVTSNKLLAKERMNQYGLPTPRWIPLVKITESGAEIPLPGILKNIWEDASIGLNSSSVFYNKDQLITNLNGSNLYYADYFIEEYIPGREFNISVIGTPAGARVLPPAEILFINFPSDKPAIVDYLAKWDTESFEYKNTRRTFDFNPADGDLLTGLHDSTLKCWEVFNLKGYARVDFRVRENGKILILEINANPCISPDSGFAAACAQANIPYIEMIDMIIQEMALP